MEEGRWKRGKRREKGSIRYIPNDFFSGLGGRKEKEEKREGHLEKSEEKYWFFVFLYLYIYIYYYLVVFSCI